MILTNARNTNTRCFSDWLVKMYLVFLEKNVFLAFQFGTYIGLHYNQLLQLTRLNASFGKENVQVQDNRC